MKVSIITLTYNSEENISECLESIKAQNYNNIEHIIIDGLSSDRTIDIINKNSNENTVVISEKDEGIYDAWSKGFQKATGDIIGTVMSDDRLENEHVISTIVKSFKSKKCDILYANMYFESNNKILRKWKPGSFSKKSFYLGWMPPPPTVYVSKKILKNNKNFDKRYRIAGDYEWLLRLFFVKDYKIFYLNKFIYNLRMGGVSNSSFTNILKGNIECYNAWKDNNISKFPFWIILKPFSKIFQIINLREFFKFYFLRKN